MEAPLGSRSDGRAIIALLKFSAATIHSAEH
jgi:hypothetical protein